MTILEKMDAVLFCLNEHSGDNPDHEKLAVWLKDKPIDKGEIEDCLLHLFNAKQIYCEIGGDRTSKYSDIPDAHYLISFEGKVYIEQHRGYANARRTRENDERVRKERERRLADGTTYLAIGTIALLAWELLKYFLFEGHWTFFVCGQSTH